MAELIKGKQLAKAICAKAAPRVAKLSSPPGLAVILVGNDPASTLYVGLKERAASEIGMYVEKITLPENISEYELIGQIKTLNERDDIHGILVQFPLPNQDEDRIVAAIAPEKDVDGFHPENRKQLTNGAAQFIPPVILAIMKLIRSTHQPLKGKQAIVIGNSHVFAEPLLQLLKEAETEPQFLPKDEPAIAAKTRVADIVVIAVGEAEFLKKDMVKPGAIIVDVGTNKKDGKTVGDACKDVRESAAFVSPVPGGVGPLTVAYLLMNVLKSALQEGLTKK